MNIVVTIKIIVDAEQISPDNTRNLEPKLGERKEIVGDKSSHALSNNIGSSKPLQSTSSQSIQRPVLESSAEASVSSNVAATGWYTYMSFCGSII